MLIGNLLLGLALVPLLLVLETSGRYALIILFALLFGMLFSYTVVKIPALEMHHHILGTGILSVASFIVMTYMVSVAETLAFTLRLGDVGDPIGLGLLYGLVFLVPYAIVHALRT